MKLLFCEGSSISARESLTALGLLGHEIIICDPNPFCICRFTSFKIKYYKCPLINEDTDKYFDRILEIIRKEKIDILIPVHEQALLFSKHLDELRKYVKIELPVFENYIQLFSKIKFLDLLTRLKIPHPETILCKDHTEIRKLIFYPCFLKTDYGTASSGVWKICNEADLNNILETVEENGNEYLLQEPARGKFEIAYSLFDNGNLISFHSCQRIKEGARGSSCAKVGVDRPDVQRHFEQIGKELNWHGPLAIDYFYNEESNVPLYIDASPRLVEPMNAVINGINIPELLVNISACTGKEYRLKPSKGLKSHMLMMSLLFEAERTNNRKEIVKEIILACKQNGLYSGSTEEFTNPRTDLLSSIPLLAVIILLLFNPKICKTISTSTVNNYALSYKTICKISNS
jgi:hypothetical protein